MGQGRERCDRRCGLHGKFSGMTMRYVDELKYIAWLALWEAVIAAGVWAVLK